jgi:drug/metabolite transporter (DMT)-like permease
VPPLHFAALLVTGASVTFTATLSLAGFDGSVPASTWALVALIALIPGVLGTTFMLAGVGAIGPSLASILLTLEPPVAVLLAWLVLGEHLNAIQIAGGVVILVAASLARRVAQPLEAELEVHA